MATDVLENKVYSTTDYNRFNFIQNNRNINMAHLAKLRKSIMKKDLLPIAPILVDKKFNIIDGQHRFACAREMGKKIYYLMSTEEVQVEDIAMLNNNVKSWNPTDYLYSFCSRGIKDYIQFRDFKNKWGFGYTICLSLLSKVTMADIQGGNNKNYQLFKTGKFKIYNIERANKIAKLVHDYIPFQKKKTVNRAFVTAIVQLSECKSCDHEKTLKKLENKIITYEHTAAQYIKQITELCE